MNEALHEALSRLPTLLGGHMNLVLAAMLAGLAISLPAGIYAAFQPRVRTAVLSVASVLQTIPGLALLALMVLLLGQIGFVPAVLALTVYSILPIIRNTVTGVAGVDPHLVEAARGLGMTRVQLLWRVQLPLAAPVIIAGIRTATTWVVGTATLSTPVGSPSLGNYIFEGLQTRNFASILVGCVMAAVLAIVLDQVIALAERGAKARSRPMVVGAAVAVVGIALAGMVPRALGWQIRYADSPAGEPAADKVEAPSLADGPPPQRTRPVRIGGKPFTEQYILTALMSDQLAAAGFDVDVRSNLGSTVLFDALRQNELDAYVDYSGTLWATVLGREGSAPRETVLIESAHALLNEHGVVQLGILGFENAYSLAMRQQQAAELGIRSIGDLAEHAGQLRVGGDYEFFGRTEWQEVVQKYGLRFREEVGMDPSLMYEAAASGQVDVISAYSTDGRIDAYELVVLEDPRQAFPPYDAVLLLSPEAVADRALVKALQPLLHGISNEEMRAANKLVDVDGRRPTAAARILP